MTPEEPRLVRCPRGCREGWIEHEDGSHDRCAQPGCSWGLVPADSVTPEEREGVHQKFIQVIFRLPKAMHRELKELAAAEDRTMAQTIRRAVKRYLEPD